jgi:hypothetical protein
MAQPILLVRASPVRSGLGSFCFSSKVDRHSDQYNDYRSDTATQQVIISYYSGVITPILSNLATHKSRELSGS